MHQHVVWHICISLGHWSPNSSTTAATTGSLSTLTVGSTDTATGVSAVNPLPPSPTATTGVGLPSTLDDWRVCFDSRSVHMYRTILFLFGNFMIIVRAFLFFFHSVRRSCCWLLHCFDYLTTWQHFLASPSCVFFWYSPETKVLFSFLWTWLFLQCITAEMLVLVWNQQLK